MKKYAFSLILTLFISTQGFALLSPLNQSINEFTAVLISQELNQNFEQGDTLQKIERNGDQFVVKTQNCTMIVDLVYSTTTRVGPREFKLIFHEPN